MSVLEGSGLTLRYGGVHALSDVDLAVEQHVIHAVIGPNGAGKTSLVNVCSGVTRPTSGTVTVRGTPVTGRPPSLVSRAGVARTFQNIQLFRESSALENVLVGAEAHSPGGALRTLVGTAGVRRAAHAAMSNARRCLDLVGLADRADHVAGSLPHGSQRLLEVARALATDPSVMLLDEPGAGLNDEEKASLAGLLRTIRGSGVSVMLVEHDMQLVMEVADVISVLNFGTKIAEGRPDVIATDPEVIDAYLGTEDAEAGS